MSLTSILEALPWLCKLLRGFTGKKVKRSTVLIIEDNAVDALALELLLRKLHYECEIAGSAEVARALMRHTFYTFIFVDLRLPSVSGEALLRVLSEESPNAKLVIVCGEPRDLGNVPEGKPFVFIRKGVNSAGLIELFKLFNGYKV